MAETSLSCDTRFNRFKMKIRTTQLLNLLIVAVVSVALTSRFVDAQDHEEPTLTLTHIGVNVADVDAAVRYYTEVVGLPEVNRRYDDDGNLILIFLRFGENSRLEINPATPENPPGLGHFGVNVPDLAAAKALYGARGAEISETITSSSGAQFAYVTGPHGAVMELLQTRSQ